MELATPYLPVYVEPGAEHPNILTGDVSAIFGGSRPALLPEEDWPRCGVCDEHLIPYIQINVSSPQTPSEFRQKVGVSPEPGCSVVLQVFVCASDVDAACFQDCIVSGGGGTDDERPAWLVRLSQLDPARLQTGAAEAARAREEMEEDKFFLPLRVVSRWAAGRPETMDEAEFDEDFYETHAPAEGLKLLGFPIQGKLYSSEMEECPKGLDEDGGADNCSWRCLLQLGTSTEEGAPLCVVGNTWINQCAVHPDVLAMTIGGDW